MARVRKGRKINGILLLDKEKGISSNFALQQVKRIFNAQKAGHTGSLDPLATGILPICLGEATKFAKYLLADDKTYIATAKLGATTTTLDSEGEIVETFTTSHIDESLLQEVVQSFLGKSYQIPPMFSALKKDGVPLYKLARKGEEIQRKQREINVFSIELLGFTDDEFEIKVKVSKGTYIRSLVDDIGKKLNSGAYITDLRRVEFANFDIKECCKFDYLSNNLCENDAKLLEINAILPQFERIDLNTGEYEDISFGRRIKYQATNKIVKMFFNDKFIGIAEIIDNILHPKRLLQL